MARPHNSCLATPACLMGKHCPLRPMQRPSKHVAGPRVILPLDVGYNHLDRLHAMSIKELVDLCRDLMAGRVIVEAPKRKPYQRMSKAYLNPIFYASPTLNGHKEHYNHTDYFVKKCPECLARANQRRRRDQERRDLEVKRQALEMGLVDWADRVAPLPEDEEWVGSISLREMIKKRQVWTRDEKMRAARKILGEPEPPSYD